MCFCHSHKSQLQIIHTRVQTSVTQKRWEHWILEVIWFRLTLKAGPDAKRDQGPTCISMCRELETLVRCWWRKGSSFYVMLRRERASRQELKVPSIKQVNSMGSNSTSIPISHSKQTGNGSRKEKTYSIYGLFRPSAICQELAPASQDYLLKCSKEIANMIFLVRDKDNTSQCWKRESPFLQNIFCDSSLKQGLIKSFQYVLCIDPFKLLTAKKPQSEQTI